MDRVQSISSATGVRLGVLLVVALVAAACGGDDGPGPAAELDPSTLAVAEAADRGPGKIAFVSRRDGDWEIYVMNADGSSQTRLTNHPTEDSQPRWSPDGTQIAFVSFRDGNGAIYTMNPDGSGLTRITDAPGDEIMPSWSPDGTSIAYSARVGEGNFEIYVMDADGSNPVRLTFDLEADEGPAWSPDGTRIAFTSTRLGQNQIFVMNADGSDQAPLTHLEPTGIFNSQDGPAWSPDGTRIAFHAWRDIAVINTDGTNETRLTNDTSIRDRWAAWSPDGSKITFSSDRDGSPGMFVMNTDGSNVTRLTTNMDARADWASGSVSPALAPATAAASATAQVSEPAVADLELVGTALTEPAESPLAGVYVHGDYAFVGSQSVGYEPPHPKTGIRIVDISDPANPQLVGRIPLRSVEKFSDDSGGEGPHSHGDAVATSIGSPSFQGDIAIVLQGVPDSFSVDDYPMPFGIWEVTDPTAPQFLGTLSLGNYFSADSLGDKPNDTKAVYGQYFYTIYSNGQMADPRDREHDTDHHLAIVDLSDPRNPVTVGDWQDTKQVRLVGLSVNSTGTRVYVIGEFGRELLLYVLDVRDPANPVELARFVWPLPFAGSFSPGRPVPNADDSLVVFADGSWEVERQSGLHILDISDLSDIREISTVNFHGDRRYWAHDLAIKGDVVYSTWLRGGLQRIDISDPANPVVAGGFLSPGERRRRSLSDVAMYGDYAVAVTVYGPGLYILR